MRQARELSETIAALEAADIDPPETRAELEALAQLIAGLRTRLADLERAADEVERHEEDPMAHAQAVHTRLVPAMDAVREHVDEIERLVAQDLWPVADYNDLLAVG